MKLLQSMTLAATLLVATAVEGSCKDTMSNGNDLLDVCATLPNDQSFFSAISWCRGYVFAISDASHCGNTIAGFSSDTPVGVESSQLQRIVVKWLNDHPELLHFNASGLVARALQEAFPCK